MTKKQEVQYHIIFWVLFIGMNRLANVMVYHYTYNSISWEIMQTTAFMAMQMLIFYLNYAWLCPKTVPLKQWKKLTLGGIALILLWPLIRYIVEEVIIFHITGSHNYAEDSRTLIYYVYDNSYYSIRILMFSTIFYFIKYLLKTNVQISNLQIEKKQAELQALKNQLSPHFLFNALNSFYADLFDTQPKVAEDILKLSEMLRYVTYENEEQEVQLKDEITFLNNYIALFQRRFEHSLAVKFTYPEEVDGYKIPSLLLIHFVENAFKHGSLDNENYPVLITINIASNRLLFTVFNNYKHSDHYDATGIGNKNIEQRLHLIFPENHSLAIQQKENQYHITLDIPLLK
ncbi:sensor histidine kinase [Zhouia sp. PK063]|uniref:sensor histidine kinase n=1 Tax=Zhouia sp. PK063 TaxID=3373602 RepID=UPI0037A5E066